MEELRLPWSPKEGLLFGTIISLISCTLIGGANVYLSVPHDTFLRAFVTSFPFVFIFVMLISNTYVSWIAKKFVMHYIQPNDSPNTYICFNLIMCVLLMSVSMSLLGPFAGQISSFIFDGEAFDIVQIFDHWQYIWPRNFCIAFWIEMCVAQPAARAVMTNIHKKKLAQNTPGSA